MLSGEWRPVPGFSRYEVTQDGDVRNGVTGRVLRESRNPVTGAYFYTLRRDDGRNTSRNYASLVRDAWEA